MSTHLSVIKNESGGVQVKWRGVLFTIRENRTHGLYGSIAVHEGEKTLLLEFHGHHPEAPMPFHFHEVELPKP